MITHNTAPARPNGPPPNCLIEGSILRHVPTGLTVVIPKPGGTAELRKAHSTLLGLIRFAGRHDDRSIAS